MSAAERLGALKDLCFVGRECTLDALRILLLSAKDERERDTLRAAARPSFVKQAKTLLLQQSPVIRDVGAGGDDGLTLLVDADKCDSYFFEDVARRVGAAARLLGFDEVECRRQGGGAKVPL